MGKIKPLIYCILFAVTPSLFAHKERPFPVPFDSQTVSQAEELHHSELGKNQRQERLVLLGYDEVIQMLEEVESGKLDEKDWLTPPKGFDDYITDLAVRGILPPNASEKRHALWHDKPKDRREFCKKYRNEILIGGAIEIALYGLADSSVISAMIYSASEDRTIADAVDKEISLFKEFLAENNLFEPPPCELGLPIEETARVIGSIFGHRCLDNLSHQFSELLALEFESHQEKQSDLDFTHDDIDRRFSTNFSLLFSGLDHTAKFNALAYRAQEEATFQFGHYVMSLYDLNRAIQIDPTHSDTYLDRGTTYFEMGQYDKSIEDFNRFTAQQNSATSQIPEKFTLSFAKAVPIGIYESGKGLFLFAKDLIIHPIHTATQMYDALSTLAKLAIIDHQWEEVGKILSPEIHKLVTEWETLSSDQRGKLAGNAFGKLGADIFVPGATAKIASRSLKGAKELSSALKNVKKAEKTYVLEAAAQTGNTAQVGKLVHAGKNATVLGEELGLPALKVLELEQAGKLSKLNRVVPSSESKVLKSTRNLPHGKTVKRYLNVPEKEIRKSLRSYEKQIAKHKDKIANPANYVTDWEKRGTKYQEGIVNETWPEEIKGFETQRDLLREILKERLSYE